MEHIILQDNELYKDVKYKGKNYEIEICWSGSSYAVRAIGISGFISIPMDCLDDIQKIKPFIIQAIEYKSDTIEIEQWDGVL